MTLECVLYSVKATVACARLSDSLVGTYLQRAKRKQDARDLGMGRWLNDFSPLSWSLEQAKATVTL